MVSASHAHQTVGKFHNGNWYHASEKTTNKIAGRRGLTPAVPGPDLNAPPLKPALRDRSGDQHDLPDVTARFHTFMGSGGLGQGEATVEHRLDPA